MTAFIDDHREACGVEPICKVLPIAPSTYYAYKAREADPALRSARAQSDEELRVEIQRVWDENRCVYGPKKVWKQLKREGFTVARCTLARLMREMGLRGVTRGRRIRTTVPADLAERPLDLVEQDFTAERPNQLMGLRPHVRRDVAGLRLRRLRCGWDIRNRRVLASHRRLARVELVTERPGARRARTSHLRALSRRRPSRPP